MKYIANSTLCHREKVKVQSYPLQMTEIPEWPFDKIAIDLVAECETSTSGTKPILTVIDHLTGWWEAFPTKDPANWDKYLNQVPASYRVTTNLATAEAPFFLVYGRDPNLPLHQLLEPMQCFLSNPESGLLNLEAHWLALAIAMKKWDENHFRISQKTMDREPPSFKIGDRVYFKNKQPGKWDLKWRPRYRFVHIEHNEHYLHIKNQATGKTRSYNIKDIVFKPPIEFWNINTQFYRAWKYISYPANLPTIILNNWRLTPHSCK